MMLLAVAAIVLLPGLLGAPDGSARGAAPAAQTAPSPSAPPRPAPPPLPQLKLVPESVPQGSFAMLTLAAPSVQAAVIKAPGLPTSTGFFLQGDRLVGFIGVPADQKPGDYPVNVHWASGAAQISLRVTAQKFTEDHMQVSAAEDAIRTDPQQADDDKKIAAAHAQPAAVPLWSGPFLWPAKAPITTEFGEKRYVNGAFSSFHTGIDIGAATGTPVLATAAGKVVLADRLVLTGNTVIVDHGLGIYSFYGHMQSLAVKVGDRVDRGQVLGKVGSTGFSTGPHLHWTMSIKDVPVDPRLFADHTLLDR